MKSTRRLSSACILLAGATLALGYGLGRLWGGAVLALFGAALWLALRRRWGCVGSLMLALVAVGAALGSALALDAAWMVLALVLALSAWDLDDFLQRVERAGRVEGRTRLERAHLQRLAVVAGLGLAAALLALSLRIGMSFGVALLLGLLGLLGLSQAVRFVRRESGPPQDKAAWFPWRWELEQIVGHPRRRQRSCARTVSDYLHDLDEASG